MVITLLLIYPLWDEGEAMFNMNREKTKLDPNDVESIEGGVIARLWRMILHDFGAVESLDKLASRAELNSMKRLKTLEDHTSNNGESNATKVKTKSQIIQQATSGKMSFKIFISLLRSLLGVKQIRLTVYIKRATGEESIHSTPLININGDGSVEPNDLESDEVKEGNNPSASKQKDSKDGKQ